VTSWQILIYFFRLGLTGFGGPLALIAQIQRDLVDERKIIDRQEFINSLSLIKSLPGPVANQVVAFWSYRLAGPWVALLAAILFILPAFLMMVALAIFYDQFRASPELISLMDGFQAGAFVLIVVALYTLTKGYYGHPRFWIAFIFSLIAMFFFHLNEPIAIVGSGLISALWQKKCFNRLHSIVVLDLFWLCLKAGALAFGTGFAILPLLQRDFVDYNHWITKQQFLDAIAFGQLTPGPVSVTVTFIGYRVAGIWGALLATIGIYLPGTLNMLTWFPRAYQWFSRQQWVERFVLGATAAIGAGIIVALSALRESLALPSLIVPIILFLISLRRKMPSWVLVVYSGVGWWLVSRVLH